MKTYVNASWPLEFPMLSRGTRDNMHPHFQTRSGAAATDQPSLLGIKYLTPALHHEETTRPPGLKADKQTADTVHLIVSIGFSRLTLG